MNIRGIRSETSEAISTRGCLIAIASVLAVAAFAVFRFEAFVITILVLTILGGMVITVFSVYRGARSWLEARKEETNRDA